LFDVADFRLARDLCFCEGRGDFLEVTVYQNQVERALKVLKRQLTKDGLLKELKARRFYEKPSVKKKRKQKEAKKKRKAAMKRSSSNFTM
jgi:small subunit ribosomal protein S21|tara:strand:+ start:5100 stop:5369 length:270 start_codon:yes stop_codon:yes gene_type:complete